MREFKFHAIYKVREFVSCLLQLVSNLTLKSVFTISFTISLKRSPENFVMVPLNSQFILKRQRKSCEDEMTGHL